MNRGTPVDQEPSPEGRNRDSDLVEAARRGDRWSFGALVERHRGLALALADEMLGDSHVAADVVQEAAVTAFVGLDRLRTPGKFGSWFAGIALNLARRWWRDARRTNVAPRGAWSLADDPEDLAVRGELAGRIRAAVGRLPPGQREAVLAFYWKGLSHVEAAVELGVSAGAVKARLHQARASLAPSLAWYVTDNPEDTEDADADGRSRSRKVMPMPQPPRDADKSEWIAVEIDEVRRTRDTESSLEFHAVLLRERGGERRAPIYIGASEATALAFSLETVETPRPMTYAMALHLVTAAQAAVADIRITRLSERTVYAVVAVETEGGRREVDARPSDALNLALVSGAPVLVEPAVFDALEACALGDWRDFPDDAGVLVAEAQDRQSKTMAVADTARQDRPGRPKSGGGGGGRSDRR